MKTITTLETAIEHVHQQSANHYDSMIAVRDMRFESLERLDIAGQSFGVLPSAQRLLANRLRVPFSYLARCPQDLQAENLNYWLEREALNRETFFCRFASNDVRAVFTERYTAIDHMEILAKMLEYGYAPSTDVRLTLDREMMMLNVLENEREFYLFGNDRIVPGISISNSEVGVLALSIEAFYYRLVCSNGLIQKTAMDARYRHVSRKIMEEFPLVLKGVISQSRYGKDRFMISTQTPVSDPVSSIEAFSRQFQLTQEETQIVKQAFYQEEGATMFHVIHAFTRAAQFPSLAAPEAYRLEKAGGVLLEMVKS